MPKKLKKIDENNYKYLFKMQFEYMRKICGCKLQNLVGIQFS